MPTGIYKHKTSQGFQKGHKLPSFWLGKKRPKETIEKMRKIMKGNKYHLGKPHSEESKKKMRESNSGDRCYRWIKDRTKVIGRNNRDFGDPEYKQWRKNVCDRDHWKCRINNSDCKGRLEVHHILGWKNYPELRYEINNGITLCHAHHPKKREEEAKLSPYFKSLVAEMNYLG